jgi:hypothetical protein
MLRLPGDDFVSSELVHHPARAEQLSIPVDEVH